MVVSERAEVDLAEEGEFEDDVQDDSYSLPGMVLDLEVEGPVLLALFEDVEDLF